MSFEAEPEFTFDWKISMSEFVKLKTWEEIQSPVVEAEKLKGSQWFLKLIQREGNHACYLHRHGKDPSETAYLSVTVKVKLIDSRGKVLKSVVESKSFLKGSYITISGLLAAEYLELLLNSRTTFLTLLTDTFTISCHIIEDLSKKRVMIWDAPNMIQTQWKIQTFDFSNWPKKMKAPLHEYTHIDITMSEFDDTIIIRVDKVDLLQPYTLKILVLNKENDEIDFKDSKEVFRSTDASKDFTTQIPKSQLVDKSCFILAYSFTLICVVSFSTGNLTSKVEDFSFSNPTDEALPSLMASCLPLHEDLKGMLLNEKHSDVKLRVHDKIIPAHKCLLSARSPVFSAMFDQDMLENQTGIVDIPDIESDTLQSFLEFLYTDTITNTDFEAALKLMLVADKYQVSVLKDRCSKILMSIMSPENVCEVVSVADMVNDSSLKLFSINFIKLNKKEIVSSPVWSDWVEKNMKLAIEILSKLIID